MLLVGSLAVALSLFVLGFYVGNQVGQTATIREHLAQTRSQRQTMQPRRLDSL